MIKSRLYALFGQIEHEFDLLLEENIRLKQMIIKDSKLSTSTLVPVDELTTTNDTKTTSKQLTSNTNNKQIITNSVSVPSGLINRSHQEENNTPSTNTTTTTITSTAPPPSSSISSSNNNSTVNIISKSLFQSKARINNLSFPKFKPNAREFIMQSIKNTSAQIVNKNNGNLQAKLQTTLSGHSDGIWDINVQSIPNHLINFKQHNSANNLLIGTASADIANLGLAFQTKRSKNSAWERFEEYQHENGENLFIEIADIDDNEAKGEIVKDRLAMLNLVCSPHRL